MHDASQRGDNAAEKFAEFAAGDQNVVDVQQDLQTVALFGELLLVGLGGLEVESIVHGDGDLSGDALHELNIGIGDGFGQQPAESHGAQAALCGGQRKSGK